MSLVTVSGKRNRIYRRKFDHDEAQTRHAAGESVSALAREYGVSAAAVDRVVSPWRRAEMQARTSAYLKSGTCSVCGKEGVTPYGHNYGTGRKGRCRDCFNAEQATSVRMDTLRCTDCHRWLPDEQFAGARNNHARRGRHRQCRECSTKARRDYRNRQKVPCQNCGRPTAPPHSQIGASGDRRREWVLCRQCFPRGGAVAIEATFVVLVEEEQGLWREQARVASKDRQGAIGLAFNGDIPQARVAVVSLQAFKAGKVVPVQIYDLEFDA